MKTTLKTSFFIACLIFTGEAFAQTGSGFVTMRAVTGVVTFGSQPNSSIDKPLIRIDGAGLGIISNQSWDGQVQIYIRRDGENKRLWTDCIDKAKKASVYNRRDVQLSINFSSAQVVDVHTDGDGIPDIKQISFTQHTGGNQHRMEYCGMLR